MNTNEYQFFSRLVMQTSGLHLGEGKEYLLNSRLLPVAKQFGLTSLSELMSALRGAGAAKIEAAVTEAMTTNETLFFRDMVPFEELRLLGLPDLIAARQSTRTLRLWSAASSTGQEAYSLAMLLQDHYPELDSWRVEIVATDISPAALQRGREGVYSRFEVQRGLQPEQICKHFDEVDGKYRVKPTLQKRISWRPLNLLENFTHLGRFDVIFCRNVLIYFDPPTKGAILGELARRMNEEAFLFLGAAETVFGISDKFQRDRRFKTAAYTLQNVAALAK